MRKIKIIIPLCLMLAGMVACRKDLVQDPTNAVPVEQAFSTVNDFEMAALGVYFEMVHSSEYLGAQDDPIAWMLTPDLLADNLISQQTGRGSQRTFGNWQYSASNTSGMFADAYSIIRAANGILEHIDNLGQAPERANYEGEALAARAMVHFDLLRVYAKPVSGPRADPGAPGVPYVMTTDLKDAPDRGTVKGTYDNIVADLIKAAELINEKNGVGRLNKAAVYGLLSRVYLYGGAWQQCIDAATACLAVSADPGSRTVFPDIWKDATEAGVIFKIKIMSQDRLGGQPILIGNGYSQSSGNEIVSEWVVSHSLALLYDTTDIRTAAYLLKTKYSGADYIAVAKYRGRGGGEAANLVDVKYLRVAEVLLNRAEAYAITGNEASALGDLDALRSNRYAGFSAGTETGQALKDAIDKERRLELAFEGDRWFTLKRKGLPVARDAFGDFADGTGTPYFVRDLPAGDNRWLIPIPLEYINANPNLVQNPGY
ncbi:RagB/SusD family nutrient uptake outer membrane protein [Taibaiella helva]|uniref:RagB/SusD family nutrient uptake outer membrane protein n=1 Tax=Taibaiella helva TaxID=2301235 RepID=UPI000E591E3A|nr:RagB/SusD family nutrient uptake outer membrane protein [Taibaiella helva]